ncbi:hypothetical protein ROZALSC1DRAFT_25211 [Rozella allomycis CSF55]|uniref:Uncharacterized protein n=1 Tax=Rozella allomycis (strain CSF55) TaxID=988480 RepID=A0A4P9YBA6_ROZAC|nr:hypothetical protein ROZALSC1DRAFT_25211 [Rozella allomycis CSF55]
MHHPKHDWVILLSILDENFETMDCRQYHLVAQCFEIDHHEVAESRIGTMSFSICTLNIILVIYMTSHLILHIINASRYWKGVMTYQTNLKVLDDSKDFQVHKNNYDLATSQL